MGSENVIWFRILRFPTETFSRKKDEKKKNVDRIEQNVEKNWEKG